MVVPYRHIGSLSDLADREHEELWTVVRKFERILKKAMNPEGFNIGLNLGKAGGAGFADHLHIHIVPRWEGDTNFMPVLGGVKVVPESLESAYKSLKHAIKTNE